MKIFLTFEYEEQCLRLGFHDDHATSVRSDVRIPSKSQALPEGQYSVVVQTRFVFHETMPTL